MAAPWPAARNLRGLVFGQTDGASFGAVGAVGLDFSAPVFERDYYTTSLFRSDRVASPFAGAYPHRFLDGGHEDLAVADPPRPRRVGDRLDHALGEPVLDHHFQLHLGQEVDDIFGAPVELGMPLLPPEPLGLGDGDTRHADVVQRLFHLVELERLDDRLDLLHAAALLAAAPQIAGGAGPR